MQVLCGSLPSLDVKGYIMTTYRVEWLNTMTGRMRVTNLKVSEKPSDWRQLIKERHNMISVLDIHIFSAQEI